MLAQIVLVSVDSPFAVDGPTVVITTGQCHLGSTTWRLVHPWQSTAVYSVTVDVHFGDHAQGL